MKYEIDIFHYISIYKKEWKRMLILIVIAILIIGIKAYLEPITYRSTLIALSPEGNSRGGDFGRFGALLNFSGGTSSNDIIFSMLKSRRMRNDINEHFDIKSKRGFRWDLDTYIVTGGFAVEVEAPDPVITKEIANFAVENLDKINLELNVTSQKPMVKVLDSALEGVPVRRNTSKKVLTSGLFIFLIYTTIVFFREYFSQLKASKNK